jgi:BASS family bile acid:Na+ symporter
MSEVLDVLANLSILVFVICSMLSMGLSLTMKQIIEPLRNASLVVKALVANFVLVPIAAYLILLAIPLEESLGTGLILLATAAGAPFLPKLAENAKGNIAFSVGLMVLLMVVTVIFMPLVLPLLLQGVTVNAWEIARSLIVLMIIPLAIGLYIKARYEETAASLRPSISQASNIALILLLVLMLVLNFNTLVGSIGSGAFIAGILFLVAAFVFGYFLGGPGQDTKNVLGLGTGQRNLSAAMVVATGNFTEPGVLTMILVVGIIGLILLMVTAGEMGKRAVVKQSTVPVQAQ